MRITIEVPGALFQQAIALAKLRGENLEKFIGYALQERLKQLPFGTFQGWRSVFGQARPEEIEPINEILTEEFGRIDPDD